MSYFLETLKDRNFALYYFGLICFVLSLLFLALTKVSTVQVYNVSAWYKPFKFSFSIFLFTWTMAWYCHYLNSFNVQFFNWSVIVLLGFEIIYIAIQAGRGQLSHFNLSTPLYSALYTCMALAASLVTLYTAYVGFLFFVGDYKPLPDYYLWAIRLGIILFVIFSFEGFVMGSRLTHTIGGVDGGPGLPLLNWSTKFGDPRIPHFIGMHALQVLPILSYYAFKNTKITVLVFILYAFLAAYTLLLALNGKPLFKHKQITNNEIINKRKKQA